MGESVQVSCYVNKGDMPVSFTWMFNGGPISTEMSVTITSFGKKTSVLSIEYVDQSHIGNYTCVVSNKAGIATHSADLYVKGMDMLKITHFISIINIPHIYLLLIFQT